MSYGVLVRSLESSGSYTPETRKEVKVFIGSTDVTMKPEGEHVIVKVNGSPIEVPRSERHTIMGREGHIVAKRVKLEGSNLLKNKLCGLCGDNNNNKIADVPSPGKCLLSTPKLELASYRVSLPSKPCSPLPSQLKAELERETERCVKFTSTGMPTSDISSSISIQSESLSGECMMHMHEIVDKYSRNEPCFSRIPILECGSACHPAGMREKRVSFTCMSKSNRRTHHIAEKIRRREVLHELKNLPESFSTERSVPVECKPHTIHGGSSLSGNSLY